MNNFIFQNSTKVYFGQGCVKEYLACLTRQADTILLAYGGGSIKRNGVYDEIMDIFYKAGKQVVEFSGIMANPTYAKVQEGARLARECGADMILAVGGGSVIDTAKAIAHGAANPGTDLWDFWVGKRPLTKTLPVGVVLTIPAAGRNVTGFILDHGKKRIHLVNAPAHIQALSLYGVAQRHRLAFHQLVDILHPDGARFILPMVTARPKLIGPLQITSVVHMPILVDFIGTDCPYKSVGQFLGERPAQAGDICLSGYHHLRQNRDFCRRQLPTDSIHGQKQHRGTDQRLARIGEKRVFPNVHGAFFPARPDPHQKVLIQTGQPLDVNGGPPDDQGDILFLHRFPVPAVRLHLPFYSGLHHFGQHMGWHPPGRVYVTVGDSEPHLQHTLGTVRRERGKLCPPCLSQTQNRSIPACPCTS